MLKACDSLHICKSIDVGKCAADGNENDTGKRLSITSSISRFQFAHVPENNVTTYIYMHRSHGTLVRLAALCLANSRLLRSNVGSEMVKGCVSDISPKSLNVELCFFLQLPNVIDSEINK